MKEIIAKISARREVSENTHEISFDIESGIFDFIAGQYVQVGVPKLLYPDIKGNVRNFSISSSPQNLNTISVVLRGSESGFKRTILELSIGSEVMLYGPYGIFKLPEQPKIPIVFLAGGVGISPFMSMIRYATEKHTDVPIHLLYANSKPERVTYLAELDELAKQNKNFKLHMKYGYIDIGFITDNIETRDSQKWYLAGPPAFVHNMYYILHELSVKDENIITEEMSGYDGGVRINKSTVPKNDLIQKNTGIPFLESSDVLSTTIFDMLTRTALIAVTDTNGILTQANDYFIQISQYSRKELIGQDHRILSSGYHSESFYENGWDILQKGKVWRSEIKNRAKDGTLYWVDSTISPVFGVKGEITSFVAVLFLVTDKKIVEENLYKKTQSLEQLVVDMKTRESELEDAKKATLNLLEDLDEEKNIVEQRVKERTADIEHEKEKLHLVTKNMTDAAILLDGEGAVIFANEKLFDIIKGDNMHDTSPIILKNLFNYFKNVDIQDAFQKCIKGETFCLSEVDVDGKIYKFYFNCLVTVFSENQNDGCFILISDITETKLLERSKSELVAIASHQLRTPLTAIRGNVEMLIDESYGGLNDQQHELLNDIEISSIRLISMVNDMLDITKIEQGKLDLVCEEVNINHLITSISEDLSDYARRRTVEIVSKISGEFIVQGDKKRIRHIFQNLIDNAIKYSKKTGTVDISAHANKDYIEIVIKDNGIGIPKSEQPRLFNRFYRASNTVNITGSGTGLGLYIVRSIINQMGGDIRLESEENVGTTFFVNIPKQCAIPKKNLT